MQSRWSHFPLFVVYEISNTTFVSLYQLGIASDNLWAKPQRCSQPAHRKWNMAFNPAAQHHLYSCSLQMCEMPRTSSMRNTIYHMNRLRMNRSVGREIQAGYICTGDLGWSTQKKKKQFLYLKTLWLMCATYSLSVIDKKHLSSSIFC